MCKKLLLLVLGLVLSVVVVGVVEPSRPAIATPNVGPDPDFISLSTYYGASYGASVPRNYMYAVASSDSAQIITSRIKVYMPSVTGTVTIRDPHLCTNRNFVNASPYGYYTQSDRVYSEGFGDVSRFRFTNNASGSWTSFSQWDTTANCRNRTITFNLSGSTIDVNTGMYPYFLETTALSNGEYTNTYGITAPTGAIVSPDVTQSSQSFGMRHSSPMSPTPDPSNSPPPHPYRNYSTWELPFAVDCSVTAPSVQNYVEFYDDDNRGGDGAQLQPFWLQLREYDRAGNYLGAINPVGTRWTTNGSWSGMFTSPTTNSGGGWIKQTANSTSYDYVYTTANSQAFRVYYNFSRDRIYRLALFNIFYMNTIQMRAPFESVYYYKQCPIAATLQPSSTVDKAQISYPETATFSHFLNVADATASGSVNYSVQRYRNGSAVGSPQAGSANYSGNGQVLIRTNAYTSSVADAGARICERLTLSGTGSFVNNPSEACTTVVTRPYMEAANNDVWAGGWFDHANNNCGGLGLRNSSIQSWVSSGSGATGEYGVLALGAITDFGSARQPSGSGLTFASTPGLGVLGAPTRCMANYYAIAGTTGALTWPGVGSLPSGGGARKYAVNGDLTITGGTVPAGTQAVLLVNGNVRITGNIAYANSYASQNAISALWIVATGNIYIQENVTSLSGLYVAQGTSSSPGILHTCVRTGLTSTYAPLTTAVCNNALTVYGALIADRLLWQRTAGTAGPGQGFGESIQFDPGLYLANPLGNISTGSGTQIQNSVELPPVY